MGYFIGYYVAQMALGFLAALVVMWFSRYSEYRADAGGASLAGRAKMIVALERLQQGAAPDALPQSVEAFGIAGGLGALAVDASATAGAYQSVTRGGLKTFRQVAPTAARPTGVNVSRFSCTFAGATTWIVAVRVYATDRPALGQQSVRHCHPRAG